MGVRQFMLDFGDSAFDESLFFFGCLVFGIFRQVAM